MRILRVKSEKFFERKLNENYIFGISRLAFRVCAGRKGVRIYRYGSDDGHVLSGGRSDMSPRK